jgi:hypothetical protein
MFSMGIKLDLGGMASKVLQAAERANRRNLMKVGAYCRTIAANSFKTVPKNQKEKSRPGEVPFSRLGRIKQMIRFSHDPMRQSVVIGPESSGSKSGAPRALEHGGISIVLSRKQGGKQSPIAVRIEPRPFMRPALGKTLPRVREIWRNSIKRGDGR